MMIKSFSVWLFIAAVAAQMTASVVHAQNCTDSTMNGDETGRDCGGSCVTVCRGGGSVTCTDNVANGDETGVDCGGSCTKECSVASTCADGVMNGDEVGIDCGGSCTTTCVDCTVAALQTCEECVKHAHCTLTDGVNAQGHDVAVTCAAASPLIGGDIQNHQRPFWPALQAMKLSGTQVCKLRDDFKASYTGCKTVNACDACVGVSPAYTDCRWQQSIHDEYFPKVLQRCTIMTVGSGTQSVAASKVLGASWIDTSVDAHYAHSGGPHQYWDPYTNGPIDCPLLQTAPGGPDYDSGAAAATTTTQRHHGLLLLLLTFVVVAVVNVSLSL